MKEKELTLRAQQRRKRPERHNHRFSVAGEKNLGLDHLPLMLVPGG